MTLRIFVPRDAGAVAVGADEVASALEQEAAGRGLTIEIVRTGSRGMYWLEPMVEVATPQGRVAFGPVTSERCRVRARRDRRRRPACAGAWCRRRDSLAEAAEPPDLRALRRDRSAFARGLSRPWRLPGPRARAVDWARMRSSPKSPPPDCAAAAAPVSRPASSGRPSRRPAPTANTSSAMPTKATAAPSPTA